MTQFGQLDKQRVGAFITWSTANAPAYLKDAGITDTSVVANNYAAWQLLKTTIRGDSKHRYDQDYEAAAAEHYMYIRYVAGATGDPYCYGATALYPVKKLYDQLTGNLQKGQAQSGHPVLPANPYVFAWGARGVKDGLADYKKQSGGADYKFGAAVETLASFSFPAGTAKQMGSYASHPIDFIKSKSGTARVIKK